MGARHDLDALARRERFKAVRDWCFGLGLVVCVGALIAIGGGGVGNPKTWASAYHALATAGGLRWLALPLLGVGAALLLTAIVAAVLMPKINK
jgi:hypothetical protein